MAIKIGEFDGAEQQREQVERKQSNETRPQKGASLHPTGEPGVIGIGENKSAHRKKKRSTARYAPGAAIGANA